MNRKKLHTLSAFARGHNVLLSMSISDATRILNNLPGWLIRALCLVSYCYFFRSLLRPYLLGKRPILSMKSGFGQRARQHRQTLHHDEQPATIQP